MICWEFSQTTGLSGKSAGEQPTTTKKLHNYIHALWSLVFIGLPEHIVSPEILQKTTGNYIRSESLTTPLLATRCKDRQGITQCTNKAKGARYGVSEGLHLSCSKHKTQSNTIVQYMGREQSTTIIKIYYIHWYGMNFVRSLSKNP